jgi:hypothetical protein
MASKSQHDTHDEQKLIGIMEHREEDERPNGTESSRNSIYRSSVHTVRNSPCKWDEEELASRTDEDGGEDLVPFKAEDLNPVGEREDSEQDIEDVRSHA